MSEPITPSSVSEDEYNRKSLREQVAYLLERHKFNAAMMRYVLGLPPSEEPLDMPTIEAMKVMFEHERHELAVIDRRRKLRTKQLSYVVRAALSLAGAISLWLLSQIATPLGVWLSKLITFPLTHGT